MTRKDRRRKHRIRPKPRFYAILAAVVIMPITLTNLDVRPVAKDITLTPDTQIKTLAPLPSTVATPTATARPTHTPTLAPSPTPNAVDEEWWTDDDIALLAAVISAEARGESYEGQLAVGCVVLNRLEHDHWGDTLEEVLYQKNQFADPHWNYGEESWRAAIDCLEGDRIFPSHVLYFKQQKAKKWRNAVWYAEIGVHSFYSRTNFD